MSPPLLIGFLYLCLYLYSVSGFISIFIRTEKLAGSKGWIFCLLLFAGIAAESCYIATYGEPFWFCRSHIAGFWKAALGFISIILFLYLKTVCMCVVPHALARHRTSGAPETDYIRAAGSVFIGTWILLMLARWESVNTIYFMAAAAACLIVTLFLFRNIFKSAGFPGGLFSLIIILPGSATFCYTGLEVLAVIFQIVTILFIIYCVVSGLGSSSGSSAGGAASTDYVTYIDDEGNMHRLHKQSGGDYIDYDDSSHWQRNNIGNSGRFTRLD